MTIFFLISTRSERTLSRACRINRGVHIPSLLPLLITFLALIIVSASRQENVGQENGNSDIFLSHIFLSAGSDGRNDDHQGHFFFFTAIAAIQS